MLAEEPGAPESGARRRRWWILLGALAFYAALAVVAYLPTLPLTGSHTQGCTCGDTGQQVWFLAWVPFSLTHGHSPFYSNFILYPSGVNLLDNTAMTLLGVIAAPVTVLFGPVAAYNLVLRAGFTLSALAMFVVIRRLVRWWPAALAAGLLYGFSPFMVGQGRSHEFLVFAPIPPLVLGVLAEVLARARWPAWRAGLVLGVLFGAQFLIASETFLMMVLFAAAGVALALCYRAARARIGHLVRVVAWAAGACAVIIAYPVYFFFAGAQHVVGSPHPPRQLHGWHGDLLGAFLPTSLMRFAPPGLLHIGAQLVHGNLQENGTYLGLPLVLITAGLGIAFRRRPVTAVASALAVLSYALSLGDRVFIAGHATAIPGPFALLDRMPVFQDIEPVRFSLFTALFVAVVLGTGLDQLRFPAATGSIAAAASAGETADGPVPAAARRTAAAGRSRRRPGGLLVRRQGRSRSAPGRPPPAWPAGRSPSGAERSWWRSWPWWRCSRSCRAGRTGPAPRSRRASSPPPPSSGYRPDPSSRPSPTRRSSPTWGWYGRQRRRTGSGWWAVRVSSCRARAATRSRPIGRCSTPGASTRSSWPRCPAPSPAPARSPRCTARCCGASAPTSAAITSAPCSSTRSSAATRPWRSAT